MDELTLRAGEAGMVRTFINTPTWRGPPHMDEDWHEVCLAICRSVEGAEINKAQARWMQQGKNALEMSGATGRGDAYCGPAGEQGIVLRNAVRKECVEQALVEPSLALSEALWRVKEWEGACSSTAGGSSS